jgi:NTP pyrophosphatase (non-canonical NTP hydrolase)
MPKPVALPTFSKKERAILSENAARHDLPNRLAQAASEAAELSAALSRENTGRNSLAQIAEEAGDVLITLHQLCEKMPRLREMMRRKMHSKVYKMAVRLEVEGRDARPKETPWDYVNAKIARHADAIEAVTKGQLADAVSDQVIPEPEFTPHWAESKAEGVRA